MILGTKATYMCFTDVETLLSAYFFNTVEHSCNTVEKVELCNHSLLVPFFLTFLSGWWLIDSEKVLT